VVPTILTLPIRSTAVAGRTALVAGATGLVGRALIERLLGDSRYSSVVAVTRVPLRTRHPRLVNHVTDFAQLGQLGEVLCADDVFCCLGTTRRKAGSKTAFERVDYHLVLDFARASRRAGSRQFIVVSAVGANARSPIYYNRVKGWMEQAVAEVGFPAVHILQPSLLLGARNEGRPLEWAMQKAAPVLRRLIPDRLRAFRPIQAAEVACTMIEVATRDLAGLHRHVLPLEAGEDALMTPEVRRSAA
jgi:uncharacterized protein YbjT (DUF2867 family)